MRKKQQADAKNTKDEQHWLKKMEEAALKVWIVFFRHIQVIIT